MKNKARFIIVIMGILALATYACNGNKKESPFQISCHKGTMTNKTKLTEAEMNAYAIQLPLEIHNEVDKQMKDRKTVDAVKTIRGCLDIDLASTVGITDKMKARLNLN